MAKVRQIEIEGTQYPIRISYTALVKLKEVHGIEYTELGQNIDLSILETLLWYGLKSGHKAEKRKMELTRDDVEEYLEEHVFDFAKQLPDLLADFFPKEEEEKKEEEETTE